MTLGSSLCGRVLIPHVINVFNFTHISDYSRVSNDSLFFTVLHTVNILLICIPEHCPKYYISYPRISMTITLHFSAAVASIIRPFYILLLLVLYVLFICYCVYTYILYTENAMG